MSIVTDLLILMAVIAVLIGIVLTMLYWFVRVLLAAVGYEINRGTKALKKWANS